MNLLLLFLALLLATAVCAGVYLYRRLRHREAELKAALSQPPLAAGSSERASSEVTAIDQYLYDRCCRYMTEHKPFLVENFSLQDLANFLYTNKMYLSRTINRFSGRNFRQYVNYYRVMYAMELFRGNMSLRVSELAHLSGFHTPTSFFQSFTKVMGEPPSHWCFRIRKKFLDKLKH